MSLRRGRVAPGPVLDLIRRYDLRGKEVIEIGCGKGEFLSLLCEVGDNRGVGFDPADDDAVMQRSELHVFLLDKQVVETPLVRTG